MKLGLLGMWHTHADGMVRRICEHPQEFTLVGVYDRDPEVVAARRQQWSSVAPRLQVFDSPQELLAADLDGVVVEGRVWENTELARLAVESGRPVLLEKPAGVDSEQHRRLIDLARRKQLHVQMTYLFRYMSAVQEMLTRVKRGDLGRVYEFRGRLPKDLRLYQSHVEELGVYRGGIFFEMAGHLVDMLVAMLGKPARVTPFMAHHHRQGPDSFIDNGVAVFGCDGAWGIVEVPALEIATRQRRIEVYGTEGAIVIPNLGSGHLANDKVQPIEIYRESQPDWQRIDLPAKTLQIDDLREFAAVVSGRKPPDFTMEHDLAVQQALLQACGMAT